MCSWGIGNILCTLFFLNYLCLIISSKTIEDYLKSSVSLFEAENLAHARQRLKTQYRCA